MRRFFYENLTDHYDVAPGDDDVGATGASKLLDAMVTLGKDESHHARRVLRVRVGDEVELFDGNGFSARSTITVVENAVTVELTRDLREASRQKPQLDIASAIPKGAHAEQMLSQLSQLAVDRVIPIRTEYSVVDPRPAKLDRFRKSAIESAKQCQRDYIMKIEDTVDVMDLVSKSDHDLKLIASIESMNLELDPVDSLSGFDRILVLIGPEGGWAADELAGARAAGFEPWSLGPLVMRIETAASAAAAVIRYGMR